MGNAFKMGPRPWRHLALAVLLCFVAFWDSALAQTCPSQGVVMGSGATSTCICNSRYANSGGNACNVVTPCTSPGVVGNTSLTSVGNVTSVYVSGPKVYMVAQLPQVATRVYTAITYGTCSQGQNSVRKSLFVGVRVRETGRVALLRP